MSFFSPSLPSATATASTATSGSAVPPPALLAVRGGDNEKSRDNTPHFHFIHSMIIPSTTKIQKEMRGRKFKVRALCSFLRGGFGWCDYVPDIIIQFVLVCVCVSVRVT